MATVRENEQTLIDNDVDTLCEFYNQIAERFDDINAITNKDCFNAAVKLTLKAMELRGTSTIPNPDVIDE